MTRLPISIALAAWTLAATLPVAASAQDPVAIVDVTVVPMTSEVELPHHTVIVRDGRIVAGAKDP